jgi:streptogramin lyase
VTLAFRRQAAVACATLGIGAADVLSRGEDVAWTAGPPAFARQPASISALGASPSRYRSKTVEISGGVGDPWGLAADRHGNVWFAEPGCDFTPRCPRRSRPGQIGKLDVSSHRVTLYALPRIPGNQPLFVAFDRRGKLWFTTPNNSRIGEFDPAHHRFVGQWRVKRGTGPWALTFAAGRLWYTEHFGAAVGSFTPSTHAHHDFYTPSPDSHPYGIAASGKLIWFTENASSVDRVAVLDSSRHNAIREYPIVLPRSGTPHEITIGPGGHPWWTEGFSGTIGTLDPAAATPGSCGPASGTCQGVRRFSLPPSSACSRSSHTSGIAFDRVGGLVWLDDSLTSRVGFFNPSTGTFALARMGRCNAHPHDGVTVAAGHTVWFAEEYANRIAQVTPLR